MYNLGERRVFFVYFNYIENLVSDRIPTFISNNTKYLPIWRGGTD